MLELIFEIDRPVRVILDHEAAAEILSDDSGSTWHERGTSPTHVERHLPLGKIDVRAPTSGYIVEAMLMPVIFLRRQSASQPIRIGGSATLTSGTPSGGMDLFEISVPLTPSMTSRLKPVSEADS